MAMKIKELTNIQDQILGHSPYSKFIAPAAASRNHKIFGSLSNPQLPLEIARKSQAIPHPVPRNLTLYPNIMRGSTPTFKFTQLKSFGIKLSSEYTRRIR